MNEFTDLSTKSTNGEEDLDAEEVLGLLRTNANDFCFIDVRSEGEALKGAIPHFLPMPILTNSERHQVGLCFKKKGQAAAIELGHRLVAPERDNRIEAWKNSAQGRDVVVACWRGGLRSEIAANWMRQAGLSVRRVCGGYRALRNRLLARLEHLPPVLVLTGLTGSGKTDLIRQIEVPNIDLEGLANHRGSAFGSFSHVPQPSQATFENQLLLNLPQNVAWVLVEDESAFVGRVSVPKPLMEKIKNAPVVLLEATLEQRVHRIFGEYIQDPLSLGMEPEELKNELREKLDRLVKPLGKQRHEILVRSLCDGFDGDPSQEKGHAFWIGQLLTEYYDPRYLYGIERNQRPILFQGDFHSCCRWLLQHVDDAVGDRETNPH